MSTDIIITNAAILTMDDSCPRAEAIAISGNQISHIGTHAEMMGEKGAATRVIDAGGATVIPGFVESHMHLFAGAAEMRHLQLFGTKGFDELKARMEAYVKSQPALTVLGKDVIAGRADWAQHHAIDRWIGGTHLTNARLWRWDSETQHLIAPA